MLSCWRLKLGILAAAAVIGPAASGDPPAASSTPDGFSVGIGAVANWSQALSVGDSKPSPVSLLGGTLGLRVPVHGHLGISIEGTIAGGWFNFNNGVDETGNTKQLLVSTKLMADCVSTLSDRLAGEIGLGFEYGEFQSWVHSRILSLPYDVTGARNFRRGPVLRVCVRGRPSAAFQPYLQLTESALWVHAKDELMHAEYDWITGETEISAGVKFVLVNSGSNAGPDPKE